MRVTSGDAQIAVELRGDGPPVVLLAGLGDDRTSWPPELYALARDHLIVAIDNRGCGESSTPPGPYSVEAMADDAHAVVRELGVGPVAVVGSSLGGAIAQRWALRHPEDVERLVLANTWAGPDAYFDAVIAHWAALSEAGLDAALMESMLLFSYSAEHVAAKPQVAADFRALPPPRRDGFIAGAAACRGHDALGELDGIRQPTLVIAGEHDILTRPALARVLVNGLPHGRLVTVASGHMIAWEAPAELAELVR